MSHQIWHGRCLSAKKWVWEKLTFLNVTKPLIKQKSLKITKSRKKDFNTDLDVRLDLSNETNPWLKNPYKP